MIRRIASWPDRVRTYIGHSLSEPFYRFFRLFPGWELGMDGHEVTYLYHVHALIRQCRLSDQFVFKLASANFFEDRGDTFRHFRLFNFSFLQEGNRGGTDVDQPAADRLDDFFVLIGKKSDQGADLTFWDDHRVLLISPSA